MWAGTFLTVFLLVVVTVPCAEAQPVPDALREMWSQRATRMSRVQWEWQFTHHHSLRVTAQQQAEIQRQNQQMALEMARRELARQGVQQDALEKQAREFAEAFVASNPLRAYTFRGELKAQLYEDKLFVSLVEPAVSAHGVESMLWAVHYDADVVVAAPQSWSLAGRTYTAADLAAARRERTGIPWVRVWKSLSPAYLYRQSRFPLSITPELLVWLGGVSPVWMYGGDWELERDTAEGWILRQQVKQGDIAPFTVRMEFLKTKGGAPSWAEVVQEQGRYREVYRVTSWKQMEGVWIASTVVYIRSSDPFEDKRIWQLKRREPLVRTEPQSPYIPRGMPVADYRLLEPSATLQDMVSQRDAAVAYEWEGSLPSERALRERLARQESSRAGTAGRYANLWRVLPPLLLITIGILWYWRLKRVEGQKAK